MTDQFAVCSAGETAKPKPKTLDTLPDEMILGICQHLGKTDILTLRLVGGKISSIADSLAMKQIKFYMYNPDFDKLLAIANNAAYRELVLSLVYFVEILPVKHHTLDTYREIIREEESDDIHPTAALTDAEVSADFLLYDEWWKAQNDILTTFRDYKVLEEVISKLPKLQRINVIFRDQRQAALYRDRRPARSLWVEHYDGQTNEGRATARHFRAMLKGVHAAGTRMQFIWADPVHYKILDETKFGLHTMTELLGDATLFRLVLDVTEQSCFCTWHPPQEPAEIEAVMEDCRFMVGTKVLRRVLDSMPLLETLKLSFLEHTFPFRLRFKRPAAFSDIFSDGRRWTRLKVVKLCNVETDRHELVRFFRRHRESLQSFVLERASLGNTSWYKLLPSLRAVLSGTKIVPLISGWTTGHSEDGMDTMEGWFLGGVLGPQLQTAVAEYLIGLDREFPLTEDNMDPRVTRDV